MKPLALACNTFAEASFELIISKMPGLLAATNLLIHWDDHPDSRCRGNGKWLATHPRGLAVKNPTRLHDFSLIVFCERRGILFTPTPRSKSQNRRAGALICITRCGEVHLVAARSISRLVAALI